MSPRAVPLEAHLAALRRRLRRLWLQSGGVWVLAAVLAVLSASWIGAGDEGWRPGSVIPAVLDVSLALVVGMAAWFAWSVVGRLVDEGRVANRVERVVGLREGEVRGPLELSRTLPPGVSGPLVAHAADKVAGVLDQHGRSALAAEIGRDARAWLRRGTVALASVALVCAAFTGIDPGRLGDGVAGLLRPVAVWTGAGVPPLSVVPGDAEFRRGREVAVVVTAPGRRTVEVAWQSEGDIGRVEALEVSNGTARYVLPPLTARTEYWARGDVGGASRTFVLEPVDPLFVGDLTTTADYPPHTGLPRQVFRGGVPPLRIPEGTTLGFEGEANRPLATAQLTDSTGDVSASLDVEGSTFSGRWLPVAGGAYSWRFRDQGGGAPEAVPEPMRLELLPDAAPVVRFRTPGADTILSLELRQPLVVEAGDDYGLTSFELVAHRVTALGEELEPVVRRVALGGARSVVLDPVLDLTGWGLLPGDVVRYFARVEDNAPRTGVATTEVFELKMPLPNDIQRAAEAELEAGAERLEQLAEQARLHAEQNRELARERALGARTEAQRSAAGRSPADQGFAEREELERAVSGQRQTDSAVDSLSARLSEVERRLRDAAQADPDLGARMRELESLLRELTGPEIREETARLESALQRGDGREATRALEELAEEQEELGRRLEESLERFRRAAVGQDFQATRGEAEELAQLERALADALREEPESALRAEQQESLRSRNEDLQDRLERLEERLEAIGEEGAATGVREAGERAREAGSEMRQASQRAQQGAGDQAAQQADAAAERLEAVGESLEDAQREMQNAQAEAVREALERAADDALVLARRQSQLRADIRSAGREGLSALRVDESSLAQGVENLTEQLRNATDGRIPGARAIVEQIDVVTEALDRTIAAMNGSRAPVGSPLSESEAAVEALNHLALLALANAEQMGQGGQGQQDQGQQMQQALEELAQQQGDLVNQAGQVMPMQLGQQALAQQLQQMSEGQQAVSDQLGEMSGRPSSEQVLGDLEEMALEAAALAAELEQGRMDAETVRRQERLFHRLLDAGRSLERDEFSEERESEAAGRFESGTVSPLEEAQLGATPYRWPTADELRALSPGVRELIRAYFDRLNRRAVPDGGGGRR